MAKVADNKSKRERLDTVLSVFGPDPAGWPAGERAALKELVSADPDAARLLGEAAALDNVMARAPAGAADEALKHRIVAAAVADRSKESRIVPISAVPARAGRTFATDRRTMWPAAALAASFAFGLYLGVSELGTHAVDQALQLASLDSITEEFDEVSCYQPAMAAIRKACCEREQPFGDTRQAALGQARPHSFPRPQPGICRAGCRGDLEARDWWLGRTETQGL